MCKMDQRRLKLKIRMLGALTLLGIAYISFLKIHGALTGAESVDGTIGVVLGLYMCSHPAALIVDLHFFRRCDEHWFLSKRQAVLWLGFNTLVFLIGWITIFVGTTRLIGRAEAVS